MGGSLRAVRARWAVSGRRGIGAIEASGASIADNIAFSRGVVTGSTGSVLIGASHTVGADGAGNSCISLSAVRASRAFKAGLVAFSWSIEASWAFSVGSGARRAVGAGGAGHSIVALRAI